MTRAVHSSHRSSPTARTVTVEAHALVGRLIDCQILADYAASAMGAAACPENAGAVSVAREALTKLKAILRVETGRLDGLSGVAP